MADLILTREFPPQDGGIATLASELAKFIATHESTWVLTWDYEGQGWPSDYQDNRLGYSVIRIKKPAHRLLQIITVAFHALRIIRQHGIRKIWVTSWNFHGVAAWLIRLLTGIPFCVFAYGYEIRIPPLSPSDVWLMKRVMGSASRIFVSSRLTQKTLEATVGVLSQTICMPLGVDADRFSVKLSAEHVKQRYELAGKRVLLTVARLFERKGHDVVLQALPQILNAHPEVVYLIVGEGECRLQLEEHVKRLGLAHAVRFTGFVQDADLPAYYAASDIFVLPNREINDPKNVWVGDVEGFGIVFIEAAASGKPAVAGHSGGAPDAVLDGKTGILVDPARPDQVAAAVIRLLSDSTLYAAMSLNARRRVEEELHWPVLLKKYENSFAGH